MNWRGTGWTLIFPNMKYFCSKVMLSVLVTALGIIPIAGAEATTTQAIKMSDFRLDIHDAEVRAMSAKAARILAGVKKACPALHLKFVGATDFEPANASDDEKAFHEIGATTGEIGRNGWSSVSIDSPDHQFTFLRSSHQLIRYQNLKIVDRARAEWFWERWLKPSWNQAQAIREATPFLKIFTDPLDVKLGDPSAHYDANVRGGQWCVTWPRVDGQGHPFEDDQVAIWMSEGYAPQDVGVKLSTPFTEEIGKTISKADALKVALNWKGLGGKFQPNSSADKLVKNKLLGGDLEVVMPQKNADLALGPEEGASARLAWVFWFAPLHSEKKDLRYSDSFAIFVDAHTGVVIGSDGLL